MYISICIPYFFKYYDVKKIQKKNNIFDNHRYELRIRTYAENRYIEIRRTYKRNVFLYF